LLINTTIQPFVIFLQIPIWTPNVSLLNQHIHKYSFSMMEVACDANISHIIAVMKKIKKILCLVVCLQILLIVITFFCLSWDKRSLQRLSIFLLNHDLCSWIHFFVWLIKFLILMKDYSVFISNRKNLLNSLGYFLLLMIRTFFRRVFAQDFGTDIVSELIVKIFLVHGSIIKSTL